MTCCPRPLKGREFHPNYKCKPLTEKFYARHENVDSTKRTMKRLPHFEEEIEKRIRYDARNKYLAPVTENQMYGWLERSATKYTGIDREILVHNAPFDEMMNILKEVSFDIIREKEFRKLGLK